MSARDPALTARGVTRSFGGVQALKDVGLDVYPGEVHAICGENGAGKSTLMAIFAGSLRPDSGELRVDGEAYAPASAAEGARAGIGIVYQERSLMPNISVAENICMGTPHSGRGPLIDRAGMRETAGSLLREFDPSIDPDRPVGGYSIAQQQVIEIAKAEARRPRILILDEPTASIGADARERLFHILRALRERGLAVVYISHHLDEVFQIADRVTVLRNGTRVGTWPLGEVDEARLVAAMVGRGISSSVSSAGPAGGGEQATSQPLLRVEDLGRDGEFDEINFEVHAGEIVVLAGLVGAGRTEVAETLFGARRPHHGSVVFRGARLPPGDSVTAIRRGLCMMTEDRKDSGLFTEMSIRDNIAAPNLPALSRGGLVSDSGAAQLAERYLRVLSIRAPSVDVPVRLLSGGNQQKVLLAMWLATDPKLLIVDEPTKGVDVGAKEEIHRILISLRSEGVGILVVSSDKREVCWLADRVLVMRKGRVVVELPKGPSEEEVIAYASGAERGAAA